MVEILKMFIEVVLLVLVVSAVCGLAAFFKDIRRFRGEAQMSLPRAKLIEKIIEQNELERQKKAAETEENKAEKKEEKECEESEVH